MIRVSYTKLRQNLAYHLDMTVKSGTPITVTRTGGKPSVVMMSEADFNGWKETVHLLGSPRNAERLLQSVKESV